MHSIQELAELARMRLGEQGTAAAPQPGASAPQPGQLGQPGTPQPGWAAEPQPMGQQPGWAAQPQPMSGRGGLPGRSDLPGNLASDALSSLGDDIAGAAMGAAARFIGRSIGRRMQNRLDQAMSAVTARQETTLRAQIAIAERHPELRACLTDSVIFLAGGSRVLPMPNLAAITVEQSDALVAQLR